jgi:hypothetical protein
MKKFLTTVALLTVIVMAMPTFAQSFDPDNGTGNNVLTFSHKSSVPQDDKTVVRQSGLHSFAMVPAHGLSRVPQFDYRWGTSNYPFGPGYNFPYPDRPYGDPDHW